MNMGGAKKENRGYKAEKKKKRAKRYDDPI